MGATYDRMRDTSMPHKNTEKAITTIVPLSAPFVIVDKYSDCICLEAFVTFEYKRTLLLSAKMLVHDWTAIEHSLEQIRTNDGDYALAWRTAWYIWNVHKQGIMCIVSQNEVLVVPFSNEQYNNRFSWPMNSAKLAFVLDGTTISHGDMYYYMKHAKHGIIDGPLGVIKDQSAWWLNGHLLCNTAGPWSTRGIESITRHLQRSLLPWPHEKKIFFVNRRDFPLLMAGSKTSPLWPVFGRKPEVPMFYGIPKWSLVLSYYGSKENADTLWPMPEHWDLHKQDYAAWPKRPKAMFRGTLTGRYLDKRNTRLALVQMNHPDVDAGLTAWSPRCRIYGSTVVYNGKPESLRLANHLSVYEQSEYAILLYIPGHVASMRLGWHYMSGSCVIKIRDDSCAAKLQWFDTLCTEDHAFVENKHFLSCTLAELPGLLLKLHTQEGLATFQTIGLEAQKVARRVFDPEFMKSYTRNRLLSH